MGMRLLEEVLFELRMVGDFAAEGEEGRGWFFVIYWIGESIAAVGIEYLFLRRCELLRKELLVKANALIGCVARRFLLIYIYETCKVSYIEIRPM